jgi:dCMP deaminase
MNIYTEKGTKVTYNGKNGYSYDREYADKFLLIGNDYTVEYIKVNSFSTDVTLKEFPKEIFNSVLFDDIKCTEPIIIETDWDQRFLDLGEYIGNWSKDRSTKVGAVIVDNDKRVIGFGYNGFVSGFRDNIDSRHERPAKYDYTEHAEANAIHTAARIGVSVKGCTMYLKWFPCVSCTRAIIQSGITKIVCCKPDFNDVRWGAQFKISLEMLEECGIELIYKC